MFVFTTLKKKIFTFLRGGGGGGGGGGDIQYFSEGGKTLNGENWHFIGELDNHLETILYYLTLISL